MSQRLIPGANDLDCGRASWDGKRFVVQAVDYAIGRAWFRSGEICVLDSRGEVTRIIPFNGTDGRL